ncbi:HNH endonuclease signature motif containing protein [uncultured Novosphingobium sp.]|uniref:HNH endonuclease signature motif containing protein n=1 Tax=uncultured Novosphingobium sp. TaxID=292277 RepID=UPI0037489563
MAGDDDCWPWTAGKFPAGYGIIRYRGYHTGAHRVAYLIANGNLPEGKLICHRCGNPACCNPAHLYAGSHADNTNDAIAHGTYKTVFQPGAMHPNWKGASHDRA